jgi:NAD(P)-dependent dehydrogenase (short-subunit alcohol dehydrogenase family)
MSMQFCVNFLGHLMLTHVLMDRLLKHGVLPEARVVNLSSALHYFAQVRSARLEPHHMTLFMLGHTMPLLQWNIETSAFGKYNFWQNCLFSYYKWATFRANIMCTDINNAVTVRH